MAALLRLRSSLCRRSAVSLAFARHVSASPPAGATLPVGSSSNQTALVQMPSPAYIAQEELDVDLPPRENVRLAITDRAAEQLRAISTRIHNPDAALRVAVESGGCHGYQYKMELARSRSQED
ncbi:hypothetical protein AX14_004134 [Amanita brunnescens Koide BX004]|nr:hypothetical protein AX14_004134 [Amanita brunnescens Koide BX004]